MIGMGKPTPPEPEPEFVIDWHNLPRYEHRPKPGVCWCPNGSHLAPEVFVYGTMRGMCPEHIRETIRRASWGR